MKSLAKNSLYNIIYKCATVIFPLITSAYVSRILLVDGIGKVNAAQNIVQYFAIFAALGLPTYGTKIIAANADSQTKLDKAFSELFFINASSTLICTVAYYLMITVIPYFSERFVLFAVAGLLIPLNILNVDWFYQGKEEYKYITIRSIAVKIIAFVLTFVFVRKESDILPYAALFIFANAANYVFNIINLRKYTSIKFKELEYKRHFKPILILLAASIAIEIYTLADTTMLTFMSGDASVGIYSNAMRIIRIVRNMVTAIAAVFLPRLSYYYSNYKYEEFVELIQKGIKLLLFTSLPAAIGLFLVSPEMVPLFFGRAFSAAIPTTSILALSIVTVAISNFTGYQVLVTIGKENIVFYSTLIGAVVNIVLNFFLIRIFSYNGAAIASITTELFIAIYQYIMVKKYVDFRIERKYICSIAIAILIMILVVSGIRILPIPSFAKLIASIVAGAFSYGICLILVKNEFAMIACAFIKRGL